MKCSFEMPIGFDIYVCLLLFRIFCIKCPTLPVTLKSLLPFHSQLNFLWTIPSKGKSNIMFICVIPVFTLCMCEYKTLNFIGKHCTSLLGDVVSWAQMNRKGRFYVIEMLNMHFNNGWCILRILLNILAMFQIMNMNEKQECKVKKRAARMFFRSSPFVFQRPDGE